MNFTEVINLRILRWIILDYLGRSNIITGALTHEQEAEVKTGEELTESVLSVIEDHKSRIVNDLQKLENGK